MAQVSLDIAEETAPALALLRVATHADGGVLEVVAVAAGGQIGRVITVNESGVAEAVARLAEACVGTGLLASEWRWRRFGRAAMARRADRLAFGALDLACVDAACQILVVPVAAIVGGIAGRPVPQMDPRSDRIDADAAADIVALAQDALARDSLAIAVSLAACGGLAGLRRIAALARALNLDVVLQAATGHGLERARASELAAAFGLHLAGAGDAVGPMPAPALAGEGGLIRRIRLRRVTLRLAQVYVSAMYLTDRVQRTIIEVETRDGTVGLGETNGNDETFALAAKLARGLIGRDVFDRRGHHRRFAPVGYANANGRSGWQAFGGLELACWDAAARQLDLPLADLLGRADPSSSVAAVCLLPAADLDSLGSRDDLAGHFADLGNAARVVDLAVAARRRHGFGCFKYKSIGRSPAWDLAVMSGLRAALGPAAQLRFDPNAAYGTAVAAALCREMEPLALEYYEDPTDGIEGLARLRRLPLRRPIASNMVLIGFDQFAPTVRRGAIDVLLADVFHWGGVDNFRDMAAAAEALGLPVAIHSFYESGIGTAAHVHLALGLGLTGHANDQGHQDILDDVLGAGQVEIAGGRMALPAGPGLGVSLDETRMRALTGDDVTVTA